MTNWRLAYSLETLRTEVNTRWPNRNKASDGTIGDQAHASSASDHNPNNDGVVCAFDITHDLVDGPDIETLGRQLAAHPHPDCKYVIFNRKIASRLSHWELRPYTGDPHTSHVHVSVGVGPDGKSRQPYDDRTPPWFVPLLSEDDLTNDQAAQLSWTFRQTQWFAGINPDTGAATRCGITHIEETVMRLEKAVAELSVKVDALPK